VLIKVVLSKRLILKMLITKISLSKQLLLVKVSKV